MDMMENSQSCQTKIFSDINDQVIQHINKNTVHRICSGQVVLSLAIAMKELVENSIDAGATIIDIYLKEYGSELLEVHDNGSGVKSDSFEKLTLKHYTSKIREFEDLQHLGTLGFRGEALSSLCALSDLVITTRHSSAEFATKITYDRNGKIISTSPTAREIGTTVTLSNLFSTLPVRRKEFLKHLKREFNKLCQLLYAYCIVSKGIKFTCSNMTDKGSKSTVTCTDGKETIRDNIVNVFGTKQIASLIDVELKHPNEEVLTEFGLKLADDHLPFTADFLVSSVIHGSGRSINDRQFYYINSRPCEPSKIMKLVNEIYKLFNSNQYPFVFLNIVTKSLLVDVNITPDKRQVFLENEKLLLATIKTSLLSAFKEFPSTYKMQNLNLSTFTPQNKGLKRNLTDNSIQEGRILQQFKKRSKTDGSSVETKIDLKDFMIKPKKEEKQNLQFFNTKVVDEDILNESQEKLEELVEIACKLVKDEENANIMKSEEWKLDDLEISLDQPLHTKPSRKQKVFNVTLDEIKKYKEVTKDNSSQSVKVKFRSEIKSEHNKIAEEELQKQIQKSDFNNMVILGQFNKGFIITKLKEDLFIIDQHASDEKYNYEQLQQTTVIDSQLLVNPKQLELTAGNESLLIENVDVFKKNGFSFKIDHEAPCTKKVALTAIPISRNFVFAKDDIDEMLLMLQESSTTSCVPSKLRKMFASRACRKSVMIGTPLNKTDMKRLVEHMGQIDQPWNCPHGRPTMRHLINLGLIERNK